MAIVPVDGNVYVAIQVRGHVRGKTGARAMHSSRDAKVQRCVRAPGLKRDKHGHYTVLSRPYQTTNDLQGFRNYTCMNSELFNKMNETLWGGQQRAKTWYKAPWQLI